MAVRVGFIGLGDIGLPMAKRVVTHGFETTVCGHMRRQPVEEMKGLGAKEVKTPKEVAQASDVTIIMVQNDKQAEEVIFGPDGLLEGTKSGDGILLMGTFSPAFCRRVAETAETRKVDVLDAPVVGARMGAEAGTLGISVGGNKEVLEKYRPVLETMGRITYCGALGMGQIVKLVNNMAVIVNAVAAYEAVAWGIKNGASEDMLVEHMRIGSANSFVVQNWEWLKSMFAETPPPTFYVGAKDLSYALAIGHEMNQPSPVTALVCELLKKGPPKLREQPK
ncbi:MAG: NAD(P)-dependent oxidoreductase [Chloroflexi bacterium]|nr:NAD(P)-dependent oxidoreductase [Chloroflexota bacterium]